MPVVWSQWHCRLDTPSAGFSSSSSRRHAGSFSDGILVQVFSATSVYPVDSAVNWLPDNAVVEVIERDNEVILYCIVLYCIALHCIVLYCILRYTGVISRGTAAFISCHPLGPMQRPFMSPRGYNGKGLILYHVLTFEGCIAAKLDCLVCNAFQACPIPLCATVRIWNIQLKPLGSKICMTHFKIWYCWYIFYIYI